MKKKDESRKIFLSEHYRKIDAYLAMLPDTKLTTHDFLVQKYAMTIILFIIGFGFSTASYLVAILFGFIGWFGTDYLLIKAPLAKRSLKLDREAIEFFNVLVLTLEAGRNLENSLEVAVNSTNNGLSREFGRVLLEVKFGKSLEEALEAMKTRIPSGTINNIIFSMTQTNIFGSNIVDTVYDQLTYLRFQQEMRVKAEINKLPNRISIISVLFVVPLILIIVLGPFLINLLVGS